MTLLENSLSCSAILLAITFFFLALRTRLRVRSSLIYLGLVWVVISVVFAGLSGSPAVMFQFVALVLIMLGMWTTFSWWAVGAAACAATGAVYGALFGLAVLEDRHFAELRQEYPLQSMEERMPLRKKMVATKSVDNELHDLEHQLAEKVNGRVSALRRLHMDTMDRFVNAPSFGVRRMIIVQPTKERLMLEPDVAVAQPAPMTYVPTALSDDWKAAAPDADLRKLHFVSQLDFLNPRGFGYVKNRTEVAGFQSHFFRAVPKSDGWQVRTIDLVGLLLHQEPVVYVTANLPRMEELRKAPTRALDDFEAASLKKLQKGETLVVDQSPKGLRMLGAIRATQQCIACHGGDEGEMLGAFAYVLGPGKKGP